MFWKRLGYGVAAGAARVTMLNAAYATLAALDDGTGA